MATKKEVKETLDISQFFSLDNEENGLWFEPRVNGVPTGIELKIYGPNSKAAWKSGTKFQKGVDALEDIEDEEERHEKETKLIVEAVVERVCDIRGKDGKELMMGSRPATKDDIPDLLYHSPLIAMAVWDFAQRGDNFLEMKKKD